MRRSRGRRFDDRPQLNMKKVAATVIAILVIIMVIASIVMLVKQGKNDGLQNESIKYFAFYTNDENKEKMILKNGESEEEITSVSWGVINSKGEEVIPAKYGGMIIVPNRSRALFIVTPENEDSKTIVLNDKKEEILTGFSGIEPVDNHNSTDEVWYEENVLKFKKDGKYGLIDFDGNVILNADYDDIQTVQGIDRSILIYKDGKVGLFNNISKDTIIEPIYSSIRALGKTYNDGYIVVNESGKAGIIGPDKRVILENKYDDIANIFGNGMYIVKNDGVITVIKSDGSVVLDSGFEEIKSIDGENIIIKVGSVYGIVNVRNQSVLETKYEGLEFAYADNYIYKDNGKYGIINTLGETKIEPKYEKITYRKDAGFFECDNENYVSDIYSRELEYKFTGTISKVDTELGYIKVTVNNETKYYNLKFEEKSNKDVLTKNTLFLVKKDGKYGYVNKDGGLVVDYIYDDATEQNEYGFCAVNKGGKWGALKSDGSVVLEPQVHLDDSLYIDFIGKWHFTEYFELEAYTDTDE